MTIFRYKVFWGGWVGAPGVSTFYAGQLVAAQNWTTEVHTLLNNLANGSGSTPVMLPSGLTLTFDSVVDELDDASGGQVGQIAVTPPPAIVGASLVRYSAVAGLSITWNTNVFVGTPRPRRVRGRTYFVPLGGGAYQDDGTIDNTQLGAFRAAATAYISGPSDPMVWHRPTTVGGTDGQSCPIISAQIKDHESVLHSRQA